MHALQLVITISVILDIDECAVGDKGGCHKDARCVNEVGSFRCECKSGYEGNGKTCQGNIVCISHNMFMVVHTGNDSQHRVELPRTSANTVAE